METKKARALYLIPYYAWILLFVIAPIALIAYYSFFDLSGNFTLDNYQNFFTSVYLKLTLSSFWYAFLITLFSLLIAYPTAYLLTKTKHKQLWLLLIIIPSWINLLLKTYAFIGIFGLYGPINAFLNVFGIGEQQILFTDFSFIFVSVYIFIPFMILPIFNSLDKLNPSLIDASKDLGASGWTTFRKVIFPLTTNGVKAGVQAVFIPSLSLFMITRLIAGNKVITLGTAIEQQFLVTQNWGMGSTIAVFLIIFMVIVMIITGQRDKGQLPMGNTSKAAKIYLVLIFVILYAPIFYLIFYSFNSGGTMNEFDSFTWEHYAAVFSDTRLIMILINTVIVALLSALISTAIGVLGSLGIVYIRNKSLRNSILSLNNVLIVSPDVVIGASFLILFTMVGVKLGFASVLISHIAFSIPIVVLMVLPKLQEMNSSLIDAAADLGATRRDILRRVIIPFIKPGIFAGFFMALTYSLDDFAVTFL